MNTNYLSQVNASHGLWSPSFFSLCSLDEKLVCPRGIQLTPLGLCSMIAGSFHVRASGPQVDPLIYYLQQEASLKNLHYSSNIQVPLKFLAGDAAEGHRLAFLLQVRAPDEFRRSDAAGKGLLRARNSGRPRSTVVAFGARLW